jgi:hypothetical protein
MFLLGVRATGEVRLLGAKLGGDLDCTGANFRAGIDEHGKFGFALSADGLDAGGDVVLCDVKAIGEERLIGAKLGGDLDCTRATFWADENGAGREHTFSADRLDAKGDVHLPHIIAAGQVSLLGAKVGGNLDCSGAALRAEAPTKALLLEGAKVTGRWFIRGATLAGVLDLTAADLGEISDDTQVGRRRLAT